MIQRIIGVLVFFQCTIAIADSNLDRKAIHQAAKDYIESQHIVSGVMMKRSSHPQLAKRTFWLDKKGTEFVMETSFDTMIRVAETYNKNGDKFPSPAKIDIKILDMDNRVASVKLTADDWIDYMHVMKLESGEWKIINVLWQYNDLSRHSSQK
ncbi:MAG: nuclear transport factor 2 family protein [Kangiellaceae bacterium]|nr:nuclear transport factor 2 family protein [Kangiellaceae bacterium]